MQKQTFSEKAIEILPAWTTNRKFIAVVTVILTILGQKYLPADAQDLVPVFKTEIVNTDVFCKCGKCEQPSTPSVSEVLKNQSEALKINDQDFKRKF